MAHLLKIHKYATWFLLHKGQVGKKEKRKRYVNIYFTVIRLSEELLKRRFIPYIFFLLSFRLHWTILTIFTRFVTFICKTQILLHAVQIGFHYQQIVGIVTSTCIHDLFINVILKVKSLKNDYLKSFLYPMCIYRRDMLYKLIDETKTR